MENFTFYAPTYFDFGRGAESHVAERIRQFGGTKVLFHYGGGSIRTSGLYDRVKDCLDEAGIPFVELGGVKPNPRSGLVYQGILRRAASMRAIFWIFTGRKRRLRKRCQSARFSPLRPPEARAPAIRSSQTRRHRRRKGQRATCCGPGFPF